MTARTEMSAATADLARFDDAIVAMDIVDAIRRDPALAAGDAAAQAEGLRAYYHRVGIAVSDSAIATGLAAVNDNRFGHVPRTRGLRAALARFYIERRRWQPAATALALVVVLGLGGYFLAYQPYRDALARQAQVELSETMPAQMQALYQTIHEETKVQQAETEAVTLRDRGQAAAKAGNRVAAEQAIIDLTNLRDTLRAEYQLKIVDSDGKWGFWTFPQSNSEATNYFLVVQPVDANGRSLTLPVRDEDTGRTERVSSWGERVPEEVYRAVEADKDDDQVIEHNLMAIKEFGFIDPSYLVQTLGGQVTRW